MPSLILFDFDETLAETESHMLSAFDAKMDELLAPHTNLSAQEIAVLNLAMYRSHGSGIHGWAAKLGFGLPWVVNMFREIAPVIREATLPHVASDPALISRLQSLQAAGHTLAILTLGHRDYCLPLLEKLKLSEIFPPDMVFDISVMEGRIKRHEATFNHLLQTHLTGKYRHMYMFEDSMGNLIAAKKAGFTTLLVGPTHPPEELASAIDHHSHTILQALDYLTNQLLPA